jgi:serine/threonine protein kinase
MLVDDDGTVLLGDFGVGVFLGEAARPSIVNGERQGDSWNGGRRKSFVGTPCWMAPEVVERKGYGVKADIWSFGITALEMSSGRAPHSRLAPVKVLMKTLKEDPPALDRTGNAHKYSKLFDDFIRQCLQKDPTKRPSADKLLQHGFFKQAKSRKFLVSNMLSSLPPLSERQDRRRAMSIASLQHISSWDFNTSLSSKLNTPGSERNDPFVNFTASFANPSSPTGSIRFPLAQKGDAKTKRLSGLIARSSRPSSADFGSMSMSESWSRKPRQRHGSVSFDLDDSVECFQEPAEDINLPVIVESKADTSLEGQTQTATEGKAELTESSASDSRVNSIEVSSVDAAKSSYATKEAGGALGRLFRGI